MKLKVDYVDFHWDNHQGGSGKSFELTCLIDVPDTLKAGEVFHLMHNALEAKIKHERPFVQDNRWSIQKVELL